MIVEELFEETRMRLGYIICFVAAVGFICSFTYNHGYFWNFDAGMRIISIGDILTSYTLWVPSLGTLFFVYGLDEFLSDVELSKTEKKLIKKSKSPKLMSFLIELPQLILFAFIAVLLGGYLIFGVPYQPLILCIAMLIIWLKISTVLLRSKLAKGRINKYILGMFLFVPAVLCLMFALGLDKSCKEATLTQPNAVLYFSHHPNQGYPTILLRHLEKGLLAKQLKQNDYMLYTWDDISRIEVISQSQQFKGIACEWLHLGCG